MCVKRVANAVAVQGGISVKKEYGGTAKHGPCRLHLTLIQFSFFSQVMGPGPVAGLHRITVGRVRG